MESDQKEKYFKNSILQKVVKQYKLINSIQWLFIFFFNEHRWRWTTFQLAVAKHRIETYSDM